MIHKSGIIFIKDFVYKLKEPTQTNFTKVEFFKKIPRLSYGIQGVVI